MKLSTLITTFDAPARRKRFRAGWPATSRADIRFVEAGGVLFRYRERGSGPVLLFCADPPVTLEAYDELLDLYSQHFRVVIFEAPEMGFSVASRSYGFSFAETNAAIIAFMEAVTGPGAITSFSCVAGLSSLAIAAERPDLISKIILIQTPSWEEEVRWKYTRDPKRILSKPIIGQLAMRKLKHSRAPFWLGLAVGRRERIEPWCSCAQHTIEEGAGWDLASAFQNYLTDTPDLPHKVRQPLLLLWGAKDGSHPTTRHDSAREHARGPVTAITYDDLGHFPELEDPPRVLKDMLAFAQS